MNLAIETPSYNERRYGKPWIAVLDFSQSRSRPEYTFGDWLGRAGEEGELTIAVSPGDVLAKGQKDMRSRSRHSDIGVVQPDSTVEWGFTLAAARDAGESIKEQYSVEGLQSMTEEELRAEIARLKTELALVKTCQ